MNATVKCSNCGAELSNLTLSWGKRQWLWSLMAFLPLVCISIWFISISRSSRDYVREIETTLLETRPLQNGPSGGLYVLGRMKNVGKHTWERISIQAEFFDEAGRFMDEATSSTYFGAL